MASCSAICSTAIMRTQAIVPIKPRMSDMVKSVHGVSFVPSSRKPVHSLIVVQNNICGGRIAAFPLLITAFFCQADKKITNYLLVYLLGFGNTRTAVLNRSLLALLQSCLGAVAKGLAWIAAILSRRTSVRSAECDELIGIDCHANGPMKWIPAIVLDDFMAANLGLEFFTRVFRITMKVCFLF